MGRPKKGDEEKIKRRDELIYRKVMEGTPADYFAIKYGLTKGRISQIIKKETEREATKNGNSDGGRDSALPPHKQRGASIPDQRTDGVSE